MVDTVKQICFMLVFAMLMLSSCKTTEPKPASGSQQNSDFKDCTFIIDVRSLEGVWYTVQIIELNGKAKTSLTGSVEFMACDDEKCLPGKTIPFKISID